MNLTLRAKLTAIVATAAVGFLILVAVGAYSLTATKVELAKIDVDAEQLLAARAKSVGDRAHAVFSWLYAVTRPVRERIFVPA